MEQHRIEDVERARKVPIQTLLGLAAGRRQTIRCPFHQERTPSCVIYPDGHYYCFGCGSHGSNAIDFLMAMGSSFSAALDELTKYIK